MDEVELCQLWPIMDHGVVPVLLVIAPMFRFPPQKQQDRDILLLTVLLLLIVGAVILMVNAVISTIHHFTGERFFIDLLY